MAEHHMMKWDRWVVLCIDEGVEKCGNSGDRIAAKASRGGFGLRTVREATKRVLGCQDESMRTIAVVYLIVVPVRVKGIPVQRHIRKVCANSIGRVRHLAVWNEVLEIKKASGHKPLRLTKAALVVRAAKEDR
ncbi:hypothetical protein B0H13DRAFT_1869353 [Mycena leptocephala]|nr:hypothetical protein B0H13DRAFT_1869353 [Mycena leptocephala]